MLDMRAITGIARVVGLQSSQLRFQSTSLFLDPELAKQKLEGLSRQQLAEFFLLSWHPVTELEQLVMPAVKEASEYWKKMLSFFERRGKFDLGQFDSPGTFGLGDLGSSGMMEDQSFTERLQGLWNELKSRAAMPWASGRTWSASTASLTVINACGGFSTACVDLPYPMHVL